MSKLFKKVQTANPTRSFNNFARRLGKIVEELGETWEAYLNITSSHNGKGKSTEDLREELTDTLIVVLDCLLTPLPGEENKTPKELEKLTMKILDEKLDKWKRNVAFQKGVVDNAV